MSRLDYNIASARAGIKAPIKLVKEYFEQALPMPNQYSTPEGALIDVNVVEPRKFVPFADGKVGWLPDLVGNDEGSGSFAMVSKASIPQNWNDYGTYLMHGNWAGGWLEDDRTGSAFAPDQNYVTSGDTAVVCEIMKVSEFKKLYGQYVSVPVPICGFDFSEISFVDGRFGTVTTSSPGTVNNVFVPTTSEGTLGEDQSGTITNTMLTTDEFDDWYVISRATVYGREVGSAEPRVKVNPYTYQQYPAVLTQVDKIQSITQTQGKLGVVNPIYLAEYHGDDAQRQYFGKISMPCIGTRLNGESGKNNYHTFYSNGGPLYYGIFGRQFRGAVNKCGLSGGAGQAPWTAGYYNSIEWYPNITNDVGYQFVYTPDVAGVTQKMNGWFTIKGEKSKDYLRECYGAQSLGFFTTNKVTANRSNIVERYSIGAVQGGDRGQGTYTVASAFGYGINMLAFQTWEQIEAFFADWGIFATQDKNAGQNDNNPGAPETPGGGWGDWDPDNPPVDPWDNPQNPGGDPPVTYDPVNPGVPPLDPDPPYINPMVTSNGYVMSVNTLRKVQDWMCNGNFVADSSNLFTDKMSAFNGATLFPFDIAAHDQAHCVHATALIMAGASIALPDLFKIEGAYNSWFKGGEIEFGVDWAALRPDFNAFSTSSYTVFVPFVGNVQVPASSAVFRKLVLDYAVDLISGAGTAVLRSYPAANAPGVKDNGFIVGMYPCQVGQPIPFVSDNTTQRNFAITMGAIRGALGGGESGIQSGMNTYQKMGGSGSPAQFDSSGLMTAKATPGAGSAGVAAGVGTAVVGVAVGAAKGLLGAALANPIEMRHGGSIGSLAAWATGFIPYLTVTSQIPAFPNNYAYLMGQQSSQRGLLSKFRNGNYNYVECYATKLSVPGATSTELGMISKSLESGVFI